MNTLFGISWLENGTFMETILACLNWNNPKFHNYLGQMYPVEVEIKDTMESDTSASYLNLLLSIGRDSQLHTAIHDKRDDVNFNI